MIYEIFWFLLLPGVITHWIAIVKNYKDFIYKTSENEKILESDIKIIFIIATKDCPVDIVQDTVDSVNNSCKDAGFNNYEVKIVTDAIENRINNAEVVTIPKEYTCKSKYKARGLNYLLTLLSNSKKVWFFHLDEDSRVVTQTIISILKYIKDGGNPVANGPSVFEINGNVITFYGEAHRMWTFFWLKHRLKTIPLWMNGSNMLVRSDIEHDVGWDFGNYFSEDTSFGYHIVEQKGKIFGWHGGLTIEQPPSRIKELFKQRKRWFYGSLLYIKHCPREIMLLRTYSTFSWHGGFYLSLFYFLSLLKIYQVNPLMSIAFSTTIVFWLSRYQIGMYYMLKYNNISKLKKLAHHFCLLFLTPVIELLCTFPTLLAIVDPPKGFEVTGKKKCK